MDILRLLDNLSETIEKPKAIGRTIIGLDRDEVAMQISKIRASLPNELKQAVQTVRETDRIMDTAREDAQMTLENAKREAEMVLAEARKEAERIVEHAQSQQERMINESEILKLAKAQSEEIRNAADRDAIQIRRGAEKWAYDTLTQMENVASKVLSMVERGKQEIDRTEHAVVQPRERERARV